MSLRVRFRSSKGNRCRDWTPDKNDKTFQYSYPTRKHDLFPSIDRWRQGALLYDGVGSKDGSSGKGIIIDTYSITFEVECDYLSGLKHSRRACINKDGAVRMKN